MQTLFKSYAFPLFLLTLLLLGQAPGLAQDTTETVPDLAGLNVAQAAAALNAEGLRLGTVQVAEWTTASPGARGSISAQSAAAGTLLAPGSAVDVTVLQSPNMLLIYDDNDLTLVNQTENVVDTTGLRFASVEGNSSAYAVSSWQDFMRNRQCLQFWTLQRNGPKDVPECRFIQGWRTLFESSEHFWTQTSGVQRFAVLENGVERAQCAAAPPNSQDNPLQCAFFLDGANAADDTLAYYSIAYTRDAALIINSSENQWMPTTRTQIYTSNAQISDPETPVVFADPALFNDPAIVADITRLAPGQCLLLKTTPDAVALPQACTVVGEASVNPEFAFWLSAFQLQSATDGQLRNCPAAIAERPTLCIVPQ